MSPPEIQQIARAGRHRRPANRRAVPGGRPGGSPRQPGRSDLLDLIRGLATRAEHPISPREAAFRFIGVAVLVLVAYLHLMDISHKIEEGVWYMAVLFAALIVSALALAIALVRTDSSSVRFAWVGAAAIAFGAIFGFCASRAIPLPGMADHHGDWFGTLGLFAGVLELGLIFLAGYALRDRVRSHQAQLRARRRRRIAAPALTSLGLLMLQPSLALAHNGEEMTDEEMMEAEMGHDMGAMSHETMSHEPLLGSTELGIALFLGIAFVGWAGYALRARIDQPPRRSQRGPAAGNGGMGGGALES